ncbi:MAG: GFA family protein [Porphyrobacter sp.]|nr:GFA family protein [Porphyrobacter sp.]
MTAKTYFGSCQCGTVSYEVVLDIGSAITCNCSRCRRLGWTITFVPGEAFTLLSGQDDLAEFRFNSKTIRHLFCRHCGIESFAEARGEDGTETVAINLGCLDDFDLRDIEIRSVDGASM